MASENADVALQDVTNRLTQAQIKEARETERAKTRSVGWVDPVDDYTAAQFATGPGNQVELTTSGQPAPLWASQAPKYTFSDDYGDVGPRDEELEKELFDGEFALKKGKHYDK